MVAFRRGMVMPPDAPPLDEDDLIPGATGSRGSTAAVTPA
jgi:hypothetical protein